ncbi:hypothetical protein ACH4D5_32140 [Streptomyces sp. NPDC018029]|uniref:hypothetical protein n=1 Tax=Streptomyces sp. NPDC018029 TaxID=3365032 RepID=UPI0037986815
MSSRPPVIEFEKAGRISSGDDAGKYVKIQELPDSPPSYLILLAHDGDFVHGCGDYWVEDRASLEDFFHEGQWVVGWSGEGSS